MNDQVAAALTWLGDSQILMTRPSRLSPEDEAATDHVLTFLTMLFCRTEAVLTSEGLNHRDIIKHVELTSS